MPENRFEDMFSEANDAFDGTYKKELDALTGLSKDEVNSVTPDVTDLKEYLALIKVVEKASRDNISQAELITNIKNLGEIAIKIAKKIPQFAALL